eukprot:Skav233537  [mRNA]  locus=scaffold5919:72146:77359:- [translate_table: standard]
MGRIATLQAQLAEKKFGVIGLQECRTQGQIVRHSSSHLVYQSGATNMGTYGCELWLNRHEPYATLAQESWYFKPNHIHIAHFGPRHLLAVLKAPHLHLRLLVIHAPHESAVNPDPTSWWQFIQDMIQRVASSLPLVVLGDMNAKLGSITSDHVSFLGAEEESSTGHHLHSFLMEHQLWAPATFQAHHDGPSYTWVSHDGHRSRLDYILLPSSWRGFDICSQNDYDVDLATAREDHFLTSMTVVMTVRSEYTQPCARPALDMRKLKDPQMVQQFLDYVRSLPSISWSTGAGLHAELLTSWLQQGVQHWFGPDATLPRQRYMSPATWSLVLLRKQLLKIVQSSWKHAHLISKWMVFDQWKHMRKSRPPGSFHHPGKIDMAMKTQKQCESTAWWALMHRRKLHVMTRQMSRADRIADLEQIAVTFRHAANTNDSKQLYRSLRHMLGQVFRKQRNNFRPIPAVQTQHGRLAHDHQEASETWREHFAEPEGGIAITIAQLQELMQIQTPRYHPDDVDFDLEVVPQLQDIEHYILKARKGKCAGLDGLPAEIYQLDVPVFGRLLLPLIMKCSLRCTEPLRWKGGEICALPKHPAASTNPGSHRSILLADFSSKVYHGLIRKQLVPFFQASRHSMQAGGIPGIGTDMLNLFVQSFGQICHHRHQSSACLFVDIRQAFYRACRPLIVKRSHITEAELARLFYESGWSESLFHEFRQHIHDSSALAQAQVSTHQQAQVSNLLTTTWFQLRSQSSTLTHTSSGTRPGDSIADLLYAFLMNRFLADLRQRFLQHGLHTSFKLHWVPVGDTIPADLAQQHVIQACWVDDLVILLAAVTPDSLLQSTVQAISITQDLAASYGLRLNYGKDKTAVLFQFRGPTAKATWHGLLQTNPDKPQLKFACQSVDHPLYIDIVPDYVYLGVLIDQQGHPSCEIRRRFLSLQATQKLLNKGVFRSHKLPYATKKLLFQSLTLGRLLFSSGAWQPLHATTAQFWDSQLVNLFRKLAPTKKPAPGVTKLDLVADCDIQHPHMLLALRRWQLFDRIMLTELVELFAVLQEQAPDAGWLGQVTDDLSRAFSISPHSDIESMVSHRDFAALAKFCLHNPKTLTQYGKRVCKTYSMYQKIWRAFRSFQHDIAADLLSLGAEYYVAPVPTRQSGLFQCEWCSARFDTFAALCSHVGKQHRIVNVVHRYCRSNVCKACLKCYNDRDRVIHHLKYFRTGCLLKLIMTEPPMSDEDLELTLTEAAGTHQTQKRRQRKENHAFPVTRVAGPLRPWPWERTLKPSPHVASTDHHRTLPDETKMQWFSAILTSINSLDIDQVLQALEQYPFSPVWMCEIRDWFLALHSPSDDTCDAERYLALQEALLLWQHDAHPEASLPDMHVPHSIAVITLRQVRYHSDVTSQPKGSHMLRRTQLLDQSWAEYNVVEQIRVQLACEHAKHYKFPSIHHVRMDHAPIFLYIFSGRRRHGDYQSHMEDLMAQRSQHGHVLLIDLALSDRHNVYNPQLFHTLVSWMRGGLVGAILLAPPCETWSQARWNPCEGFDGPRPLRTADDPMCMPQRTTAELQQLEVSNYLLFVALRLFTWAVFTGTPGVLEHPQQPRNAMYASIWALPWVQRLRTNHLARRHLIWQAEYGAVSPKPTHFLECHIDGFTDILKQYKIRVDWAHLQTLAGKDDAGRFKTAQAKEYPSLLNKGLATAHLVAADRRVRRHMDPTERASMQTQFDWLYAGDCQFNQQTIQPDYHGHLYSLD